MARKDSENQKKSMSLLFRGKEIFKPLNTGWIDEHVACVREWCKRHPRCHHQRRRGDNMRDCLWQSRSDI